MISETGSTHGINTNSYISIGIMLLIISACIWLNNKFNDLGASQTSLDFKIQKLDARLLTMENSKISDRWTNVDMFKWAVHLQQTNPQIKVPEPKHDE